VQILSVKILIPVTDIAYFYTLYFENKENVCSTQLKFEKDKTIVMAIDILNFLVKGNIYLMNKEYQMNLADVGPQSSARIKDMYFSN
jgi:hypothetical protein